MSSIKLSSGQKINKWILLRKEYFIQKSGKKVLKWVCKCECGTKSLVGRCDLLSNKSTKCRSCSGSMPKDLSGKTFGQWKVLSCDIKKLNRRYCRCKCSCGDIIVVAAQTLSNGTSTRCIKCYNARRNGFNHTRHPLYSIWATMMARCYNKKHVGYFDYGGRGIFICDSWHNFDNFVSDMHPRISKKHSIDRIDNNKGYSKNNCRWATSVEQANNRRSNRFEVYKGITKSIANWAIFFNVTKGALFKFLERHSLEEAYLFYKKNKT